MQAIAFIDILLRHTSSRYVLCVVPVNTLQNWVSEFNKWLPPAELVPSDAASSNQVLARSFEVCLLSEAAKTMEGRLKVFSSFNDL